MPLNLKYSYVRRREVKGGYQNLYFKKDGKPKVVAVATHLKGHATKELRVR